MKFLLIACVIGVASAAPRWDESGQYRVLDDGVSLIEQPFKIEPAKLEKTTMKFVDPIWDYPTYSPYYRYYQDLRLADPADYKTSTEPLYAPYYESLADPGYYPLGYRYRALKPFIYDFKLVKDIDA